MITIEQVIPLFLQACPDWGADLEEERKDWDNEKPGEYNEIVILARHVVNSFKKELTDNFAGIFQTLEEIIINGTEDARDL